jgi:hypothetical protein
VAASIVLVGVADVPVGDGSGRSMNVFTFSRMRSCCRGFLFSEGFREEALLSWSGTGTRAAGLLRGASLRGDSGCTGSADMGTLPPAPIAAKLSPSV